jgi:hypothetical protein
LPAEGSWPPTPSAPTACPASLPGRLLRFDTASLTLDREVRSVHHDGGVTAMTCSPNGQFLLTGGVDQTIKVAVFPVGPFSCHLDSPYVL